MKKQYWWTKIPHTQRKRKKSDFELLTEFVYFYREDQFLDYEVANYITTFLGFEKDKYKTRTNLLSYFCGFLNRHFNLSRITYLDDEDVIKFLNMPEDTEIW